MTDRAEFEFDRQEAEAERRLLEAIFSFKHHREQLPLSIVERYRQEYPHLQDLPEGEVRFVAARHLCFLKAKERAEALGHALSDEGFLHSPLAIVDHAEGERALKALASKWNFPYTAPTSMWDIQQQRRLDPWTVLVLIGDDRGWPEHWRYWVAIAWAPEDLEEQFGTIPALY